MKNSFLFALALGILAACTDTAPIQVVPPLIAPPIPGLDIAKETFEIDADKGGTVAIKTGTSFKIPAQAFVDGQGQVVTGTVQVAYREFHDAVDVFLSGIPMNYDSAGISGALTTAGMFEIQASQQGKPLQMAKGKAVSMRMASYQPISEKHSFYTLDTASRSWAYKGEPTVEENTKRVDLLKKVKKMKETGVPTFPYNEKRTFVFSFMAFLDVFFNEDYSKIQKNKLDESMKSKLGDYGVSMLELSLASSNLSYLTYKGQQVAATYMLWEIAPGSPEIPKWAADNSDSEWKKTPEGEWKETHSVQLEAVSGNTYKLNIDRQGKKFSTNIRIVMPLKNLLRYPAKKWKDDYETTMASVIEEEKKAMLLAQTYRSFEVDALGIHNYDYFSNSPDMVAMKGTFDFGLANLDPNSMEAKEMNKVFFIAGDNRTIVRYYQSEWEKLKLVPDAGGRMFTIAPGASLLLFSAEKYGSIDFAGLKKQEKPSFHFKMEPLGTPIKSAADIHSLLGIAPIDMVN